MPMWSLTMERLERLKQQIAAKKAEYDELEALSEKDLWCRDLDGFIAEWEIQLKLDDEIQTNIRRLGRRASKKIGAGGKGGRRTKQDDEYAPVAKKTKAAAAPKKVAETKTHQRFAEMFAAKPKPKPASKAASPVADSPAGDDFYSDEDFATLGKTKKAAETTTATSDVVAGRNKRAAASKAKAFLIEDDDDDMSDDDFASLGKISAARPVPASRSVSAAPKAESVSSPAVEAEPEDVTMDDASEEAPTPAEAPPKRAAASKAKTWVVDSDSDDDNLLGDVGALVKGIGAPATDSKGGRLSLFAMSQPGAANGSTVLPKVKAKSSRTFEFDSQDDTNYEALAMSSPRKSTKGDDIDEFLSDDDLPPPSKVTASKASSSTAAAKAKAPLAVAKKRGRPAATKNKSMDDDDDDSVAAKPKAKAAAKPRAKPAAKPAAKAAAKPVTLSPAAKAYAKKKATRVISDDEDEDDDVAPAPAPAARARPGRAAAAKAKPIVLDDDDDEDESFDAGGKDDAKDDFAMSDDSEF